MYTWILLIVHFFIRSTSGFVVDDGRESKVWCFWDQMNYSREDDFVSISAVIFDIAKIIFTYGDFGGVDFLYHFIGVRQVSRMAGTNYMGISPLFRRVLVLGPVWPSLSWLRLWIQGPVHKVFWVCTCQFREIKLI